MHVLAAQEGNACGNAHAFMQAPQFVGELTKETSQPLALAESQLPKPALHAPSPHVPAEHVAPAFANAHTVPHAPQLRTDVLRLTSHPFVESPSQSWKPTLHEKPQVPALHKRIALARAGQAFPHAPQLLRSTVTSLSQPFATEASQLPRPGEQAAMPQTPAEQAPEAIGGAQFMPQPPQFAMDVVVLVSQPFAALLSQFAKPAAHTPSAQLDATQTAPALANAHTFAQAPQFETDVVVSVSQPVATIPSQSPRPTSHVDRMQTPALHTAPAPGKLHTVPHPPQLVVDVVVFTSQPFAAMPSQFA